MPSKKGYSKKIVGMNRAKDTKKKVSETVEAARGSAKKKGLLSKIKDMKAKK